MKRSSLNAAILLASIAATFVLCVDGNGATLRSAADGVFPIGVGISDQIPSLTNDWPLLFKQFSFVTPENCMKPAAVQPAEGRFDFKQADAFVDFAGKNQLKVVGHCLVWAKDDRTPPWFYGAVPGKSAHDAVLDRMRTHITTEVSRYKGRIAMWDVVNEALDDGTNFIRPSGWFTACGEEFVSRAFEYAHAADPHALLVYNDYNNEKPAKRDKMLQLLRKFSASKTPIHAVGLQGHFELDRVPFDDIDATISAIGNLGLKVVVSELDIDVIPRGGWWADDGKHREELAKLNPYKDGCPPDILKRQAEQYERLFRIFRKHSKTIARITFWDLNDGQSWLNYFPWRRVNHPLLFDRHNNPKPAYDAVIRALTE